MREQAYFTYIMASRSRVLYVGVTGELRGRVLWHRDGDGGGFTARYGCCRLVWFEQYREVLRAIAREKELKGWSRSKKLALVAAGNPGWVDLAVEMFGLVEVRGKADPSSLRSSG